MEVSDVLTTLNALDYGEYAEPAWSSDPTVVPHVALVRKTWARKRPGEYEVEFTITLEILDAHEGLAELVADGLYDTLGSACSVPVIRHEWPRKRGIKTYTIEIKVIE